MDPSFIPVEVVPGKTPFGLDQLRRSYKTALSAEAAIAAAPNVGDADEVFPFMFLMPISTPESAEQATRIDLVYMGCLRDDGAGNPILPERKHDDTDEVMSASSSKGINSFAVLNSPLTVQFYAPSEVLTWFTYLTRGTKGTVSDPARSIEIITVIINDMTVTFSSAGIPELVAQFFTPQIVDTFQSQEIVPGKYYQNTERKTKSLSPYIFDVPPGFYPVPYSGGTGYVVGDSITITGTGSCTMDVTAVYTPGGQIAQTAITSNSLSAVSTTPITATGGSGSGAQYTVIHIT